MEDCQNDKVKDEYKPDDFITNNDAWDPVMQEILSRCIVEEGATPKSAAVEAGISIRTFNLWLAEPNFHSWIEGLQQKHFGEQRKNIVENLAQIEDAKDAADKTMKYLSYIDKDFSTKQTVEINKESEDLLGETWDKDPEFNAILKEAEQAKEGNPDGK